MTQKEKDNNINPLVSIIIPVYNREDLLFETLDSVIDQAYQYWECILVDDGSTKETKKAIEKYILNDSRFKYVDRPINREKGANACRNYGFEISEGEYINWFDSDDIMHTEMILKKIVAFEANKDLDFVDCKIIGFRNDITDSNNLIILSQKDSISENVLDDLIYKRNWFITFGTMFKKTFLQEIDLFNESIQKSQERDFFIRLFINHKPSFERLTDILVYYRGHDDSITSLNKNRIKKYIDEAKSYHSTFLSIRQKSNFKFSYKIVFFKKQIELLWLSMRQSIPELKQLTLKNLKQYFTSKITTNCFFIIYFIKFSVARGVNKILKFLKHYF